eukprot:Platyproteum_vivax@DN350_c0_g1_i1.p1
MKACEIEEFTQWVANALSKDFDDPEVYANYVAGAMETCDEPEGLQEVVVDILSGVSDNEELISNLGKSISEKFVELKNSASQKKKEVTPDAIQESINAAKLKAAEVVNVEDSAHKKEVLEKYANQEDSDGALSDEGNQNKINAVKLRQHERDTLNEKHQKENKVRQDARTREKERKEKEKEKQKPPPKKEGRKG